MSSGRNATRLTLRMNFRRVDLRGRFDGKISPRKGGEEAKNADFLTRCTTLEGSENIFLTRGQNGAAIDRRAVLIDYVQSVKSTCKSHKGASNPVRMKIASDLVPKRARHMHD